MKGRGISVISVRSGLMQNITTSAPISIRTAEVMSSGP